MSGDQNDVRDLSESVAFLDDVWASVPQLASPFPHRPLVTLTFAQSLDARIAGVGGEQLRLSGEESMYMTHILRSRHNGILVGIGTLLNDNPQLNVRLLPSGASCPRPIILDTHLRTPHDCKLLKNAASGAGRQPWLLCAASSTERSSNDQAHRKTQLERAGARILEVPVDEDGSLPLHSLLSLLKYEGINSLMVEGGQRVISSFFSAPDVVDLLLLTIAPIFVGQRGIGVTQDGSNVPNVRHISSTVLGRDSVVACVPI